MSSSRARYPELPVLIVDDEHQALQSVEIALRTEGINNTLVCQDSSRVRDIIMEQECEVVLLDLMMPHVKGQDLLPMILSVNPDIPVIIVTGVAELETAVECMRQGAFDYMVKPVSKERLVSGVTKAIDVRELRRENAMLKQHVLSQDLDHPEAFDLFDSVSEAMQSVFRYVESVARSPEPVLITGETGVGKELMAQCVYRLSGRDGPLVTVNAAGLDENAFSDTLFGHRKGAFTGAMEAREGLVQKATGGVLFLDEIGDLGSAMQVKLLRLVQEKEYFPLGSDVTKRTDARIIVATNRNLQEMQKSGGFRADLYYRLRRHHVHIPPLRERPEDLSALVEKLVNRACKKLEREEMEVASEVFSVLSGYDFPGNIRELETMVFEAVSTCKTRKLSVADFKSRLPSELFGLAEIQGDRTAGPSEPVSFGARLPTLRDVHNALIDEALRRTKGNQTVAARQLGVSRQALSRRLSRQKKS